MKGFKRENQLLSLCGLNCGLCPMLLSGHCGGCGRGNQPCAIAKCSLNHGSPEYCFACKEYPCPRYQDMAPYDSFITHRRQREDLERVQRIGIAQYNQEQQEKSKLLHLLLEKYNDGRRKNFFCLAVNLLELSEIQEALAQARKDPGFTSLPEREKSAYIVQQLQHKAGERGLELKLRKKKRTCARK